MTGSLEDRSRDSPERRGQDTNDVVHAPALAESALWLWGMEDMGLGPKLFRGRGWGDTQHGRVTGWFCKAKKAPPQAPSLGVTGAAAT